MTVFPDLRPAVVHPSQANKVVKYLFGEPKFPKYLRNSKSSYKNLLRKSDE